MAALQLAANARKLEQERDLDGAILALEEAVRLHPGSEELWLRFARILSRSGRRGDAERRYKQLLQRFPDSVAGAEELANLHQAPPIRLAPPSPGPTPRPSSALPPPPGALFASTRRRWTGKIGRLEPRPDEPPPPPDFLGLWQAALQLWGEQPLVWVLLALAPNLLITTLGLHRAPEVTACFAWILAMGIGLVPLTYCLLTCWVFGRPLRREWLEDLPVLGRSLLMLIPYVLITLGPYSALLAVRSKFTPESVVLSGLLAAAPFHVLMAPALVLAVDQGVAPALAVRTALGIAGKRTWIHLAVLVTLLTSLGGLLVLLGWAFTVNWRIQGDLVNRVLLAVAMSLGETVFASLVAVCGMDALSAAEGPSGGGAPGEGPSGLGVGELGS